MRRTKVVLTEEIRSGHWLAVSGLLWSALAALRSAGTKNSPNGHYCLIMRKLLLSYCIIHDFLITQPIFNRVDHIPVFECA